SCDCNSLLPWIEFLKSLLVFRILGSNHVLTGENCYLYKKYGMGVYPVTNQNEDSSEKEQEKNGPGSPGYPSGEGTPFLNDTLYPADDPTPSTIKKSITSAASAAGVLVPLFLVYHVITIAIFTPAKSWINRLLGRKQMYRNPYANQVFMANFSMPEDFYSERNRYNIMYRPE
ncbi:PIR protein, partial [Plasmodium vivax]